MAYKQSWLILIVIITLLSSVSTATAHSGDTDKDGGHVCDTDCEEHGLEYGEYHTHTPARIKSEIGKGNREIRRTIYPDAIVENYHAAFTAPPTSDKVTIFVSAVRQYPNYRSARFVLDCLSLVPVDVVNPVTAPSTTDDAANSTIPMDNPDTVNVELPEEAVYVNSNMLFNGNFEFGFHGIGGLGFDMVDWGKQEIQVNEDGVEYVAVDDEVDYSYRPSVVTVDSSVPNDWGWFRNEQAYGKFLMHDTYDLGILCEDDVDNNPDGKTSFVIHMQSTDQPNARLGIYQTVAVTPGESYLFSLKGTILLQKDNLTENRNHRVEIAVDPRGNTDWSYVPDEAWIYPRWTENRGLYTPVVQTVQPSQAPVYYLDIPDSSATSVDVAYNGHKVVIPTKLIDFEESEILFEPIPTPEPVEEYIPVAYPPGDPRRGQ